MRYGSDAYSRSERDRESSDAYSRRERDRGSSDAYSRRERDRESSDAYLRRERDRENSDRYRKREHEEYRNREDSGYGRSKRMKESGALQPPLPSEKYSKNPPLPPGAPPPLPNEEGGVPPPPSHPPSTNHHRPPPPVEKGSVAATAEAMVRKEKERIRKRMEIASNVGGGSLDDARGSGKFGDDSGNAGIMSGLGGLTDEEVMMKAMGFGGFNSSKGKKVVTNQTTAAKGGVMKHKTNEYRQYMNRRGGFNRPLGKPY